MPFRKPKPEPIPQEVEFTAHVEPRGVNDWEIYLTGKDERGRAYYLSGYDNSGDIRRLYQVDVRIHLEDMSEEEAHEAAQQMVMDAYQAAQRKKLAFTVR